MALRRLVQEERPHVAAGRGHLRLDHARAEPLELRHPRLRRVARLGRAPVADPGARRRSPTVSPSSRGSGTGRPASTDQSRATSSTVRAIGPTVSSVGTSGKTPSSGSWPQRGFRPTVPQAADGSLIEQPVSDPSPRSTSPAASAAAFPADEPPVVFPGWSGLCTAPYHGLTPSTPQANSGRFALPTTTAPASSARWTTSRGRSGRGRRRSASRRSCASRRCRSGP